MAILGSISGLLFCIKITLHLYLLSKVDANFRLLDYSNRNNSKQAMALLPFMDDVPANYVLLKKIINILFVISICGVITFLIGINWLKK